MQKYRDLKEALRANFAEKPVNSRPPDLKKIKDQIRQEFRKKLAEAAPALN